MKDRNIVFVVDDDPGMLEGLQRLLRQNAYDRRGPKRRWSEGGDRRRANAPVLFSSAASFKDHTDFEKVVCVIFDINLNDGSGIELGHHLQAAGISVPVIYMTGNQDAAVRGAALNSGCIAFLTKPFSTQELMDPLNKAAGRRS